MLGNLCHIIRSQIGPAASIPILLYLLAILNDTETVVIQCHHCAMQLCKELLGKLLQLLIFILVKQQIEIGLQIVYAFHQ